MTTSDPTPAGTTSRARRADARRNEQALLDAAAAVFVTDGVDAPVRLIAARAGVGMGTIYRHFPTRPALVVAVYRHQVQALAEAGPVLLREAGDAGQALRRWVAGFVDFLVTKHGLADALGADAGEGANALHEYFIDRLVPVCDALLEAAVGPAASGRVTGYMLMRGIGNLSIGGCDALRYDASRLAQLLVAGVLAEGGDQGPACGEVSTAPGAR
ncbi:TetR/AcrR family transcriptional regulator [Promicromonospora sp. NPDC050880]|uniref:TetR/AcrR family transcriptional regulator n=1 Tax=Promicromonospora sp. NPDC050880 TaxID=3364406 RepID=UPI0037A67294